MTKRDYEKQVASNPMELWLWRMKNKIRVSGVHECLRPFGLGISCAGAYIHMGGNVDTCKRLHQEKLIELRAMPKPKLP